MFVGECLFWVVENELNMQTECIVYPLKTFFLEMKNKKLFIHFMVWSEIYDWEYFYRISTTVVVVKVNVCSTVHDVCEFVSLGIGLKWCHRRGHIMLINKYIVSDWKSHSNYWKWVNFSDEIIFCQKILKKFSNYILFTNFLTSLSYTLKLVTLAPVIMPILAIICMNITVCMDIGRYSIWMVHLIFLYWICVRNHMNANFPSSSSFSVRHQNVIKFIHLKAHSQKSLLYRSEKDECDFILFMLKKIWKHMESKTGKT